MSRRDYQTFNPDAGEPLRCSFCGKVEEEVGTLIAGPSAYICDHCVSDCKRLVREELAVPPRELLKGLPTPRQLRDYLDTHVIGQDVAKRTLAVAVYNHYKRLAYRQLEDDVEIAKSNVLLIGPSGSGKTLLAETLAKRLDVPFTVVDATSLTEAGYVGDDIESIVQKLLQACDHDPEKAARGIVYIDEIDKLARRALNPSHGRDVSGEGVQQGLLRILEGTEVTVSAKSGRRQAEQVQIDTRDILFICGGAFSGLNDIVERRMAPGGMGFAAPLASQSGASLQDLQAEDLVMFGLIPEFVGRLPVVALLDELDEAALVRVLTEPRNALVRQYAELLGFDGCALEFTPEALTAIAREALSRGTGARGLRAVVERVLLEPMYRVPAMEGLEAVVIDANTVAGKPPEYRYANDRRKLAQ